MSDTIISKIKTPRWYIKVKETYNKSWGKIKANFKWHSTHMFGWLLFLCTINFFVSKYKLENATMFSVLIGGLISGYYFFGLSNYSKFKTLNSAFNTSVLNTPKYISAEATVMINALLRMNMISKADVQNIADHYDSDYDLYLLCNETFKQPFFKISNRLMHGRVINSIFNLPLKTTLNLIEQYHHMQEHEEHSMLLEQQSIAGQLREKYDEFHHTIQLKERNTVLQLLKETLFPNYTLANHLTLRKFVNKMKKANQYHHLALIIDDFSHLEYSDIISNNFKNKVDIPESDNTSDSVSATNILTEMDKSLLTELENLNEVDSTLSAQITELKQQVMLNAKEKETIEQHMHNQQVFKKAHAYFSEKKLLK